VWAKLGTGLATGNPPDIFRVSMGGLVGQGGLESPLLVDVKEYMTEEEVAEYGPDVMAPITVDGKYVLWPQDVDWGASPVGNAKMFREAGIDLEKIRQDGWTFDEFREVAKQLTQDTDGDGEADVFGFAYAATSPGSLFVEFAHRAGAPDGSGNNGMQNWGNEWAIRGEPAEMAAQLLYDMIYVDGSTPKEVTGITDHMQLFYTGKAAIVPFWHGIIGALESYNKGVDSGEIVGEKADFEPLVLPYPYAKEGLNGNVARTVGLSIFKQEPYKGDEHTQNVVDFVRWLQTPVNLAAYANFEGSTPAKAAAFPFTTSMKNPEILHWAEWGKSHAWKCSHPIGHPAGGIWDMMGVHLTAMLNDEISPKEASDRITADADQILADWVKDNPEQAEEWATPIEGWPECYLSTVGGN
jgi:ABC-type glycerol-3-phosphate transport system substrate-binding protein